MPTCPAVQEFCLLYLQSQAIQVISVSLLAAMPVLLLHPQPRGAKLLQLVSDGVFAFVPSIWISVRLQQLSSL
jgi:hypothetical protein